MYDLCHFELPIAESSLCNIYFVFLVLSYSLDVVLVPDDDTLFHGNKKVQKSKIHNESCNCLLKVSNIQALYG